MSGKEQSREKLTAIRKILRSEWDPIGVIDIPEAADEYDGYLGPVFDLLNANASAEEIAYYLRDVETQSMGLADAEGNPLLPLHIRNAVVSSLKALMRDEPHKGKS